MKILLDENLPEGLLEPLRSLGHTVDSVGSLRLKGIDNGRLYREVAVRYDLLFTKDREFAMRTSAVGESTPVKVIFTVLPQRPQPRFVAAFVAAFKRTDWSAVGSFVEWPR